jgi:hypothetical protein
MADLNPVDAMTTDYRAMCAELTDAELANAARKALGEPSYATELHYFLSEDSNEYEPLMLAIRAGIAADRARALLAQPVAQEEDCPGCEGTPVASNSPCAVCGRAAKLEGAQ